MIESKEYFNEIYVYHFAELSYKDKYARLYNLLDRLCKELTAEYATTYTNLFGRLYAVCRQYHYKDTTIEVFRIHARKIQQDEFTPTQEDYLYDLKALCEAIAHFSQSSIPEHLSEVLPKHWRELPTVAHYEKGEKRIRIIVDQWDDRYIWGFSEGHPSETPLQVDYAHHEVFKELDNLLQEGMQLNLLSVVRDGEGILYPEIIVLNPDFLIDITSLSGCFMNYGNTPLTYLINKFKPSENTAPILMGNAANQFLDDCVNEQPEQPASFNNSIQKAFRNNLLEYCTNPDVNANYFKEAKHQFDEMQWKIREIVEAPDCQIDKSGAMLEPSFICESLGLQGRMDFLQCDYKHLIELKSGKAETFNGPIRPKAPHQIQVALYKEILYYNLDVPRTEVKASLYYSKHNMLFGERCPKIQIQKAIQLRNEIVALEMRLKDDEGRLILGDLQAEDLNRNNDHSVLWEKYQAPQIEQVAKRFRDMNELESDYFFTFFTFMEREQFLNKTGDTRLDSSRGFADVWTADLATKQNSGNILTDLKIESFIQNEGIEKIIFSLPEYDDNFLPNFRKGDIVLFYERNVPTDNATNKQVFRCNVESIDTGQLTLLLRNKQRNDKVFPQESLYAVEHDYMEASYSTVYKGMFNFLTTSESRKQLILGLRSPETDPSITLNGKYLNDQIDEIVLQAKQAKDYYLLVGPPGAGKTSVALKSMVEEFMTEKDGNLLLLSYTNRAVDEICDMLESIESKPAYVRIGNSLSCDERFEGRLMQRYASVFTTRQQIIEAMKEIRIIVGTISSVSSKPDLFKMKHFKTAIVDESSQILEPQLLGLLCGTHTPAPLHAEPKCVIDKFIFIGDPKQLPAVVLQDIMSTEVFNKELRNIGITDCRNSLFERLYKQNQLHPQPGIVSMLHTQGRMHPIVGAFANSHFYGNTLTPVPVEHQQAELEFTEYDTSDPYETLIANRRTAFIETPAPPREDSNKANRPEAREIARFVSTICRLMEKNQISYCPEKQIGIIVPFRNQIAMIRKELKELDVPLYEKITIDTVERYQGSQRDIILYSTTISQYYQLDILSMPVEIDHTIIDRKMNVAITRAKKQLFVFGNSKLLSQRKLYKELITTLSESSPE